VGGVFRISNRARTNGEPASLKGAGQVNIAVNAVTQYGIRQFSAGRSPKYFIDPMAIARRERARIGS
jgi:hypothetical protein